MKVYKMSKWLTVKEVCNELNLSENFVRCIICKPEFKQFVLFEKPIMIKFNKSFELLIFAFARGRNFRKKGKEKPIIKEEKINSKHIKSWTASAINCYNLRGDCGKCTIPQLIHEPCKMKKIVPILVKKFGVPENA